MTTIHPRRDDHKRVAHNRKAAHGEGRIGGPCHAVKADGTFCQRTATIVKADGYGYCPRHGR